MPFYASNSDNPNAGCHGCGSTGHSISDCPERVCRYCHTAGHVLADCPKVKPCGRCGLKGHKITNCRAPPRIAIAPKTPKAKLVADTTTMPTGHGLTGGSPEALRVEQPVVTFPNLEEIFLSLVRKLQSNDPIYGNFLDKAPYRDVIELFDSPMAFVRLLVDTIDPSIRGLQGQQITRARLDQVRHEQMERLSSWDLNSGYLDYVTNNREYEYWRAYAGQSHNTPERVTQHIREIRSGSSNTLHYFIIHRGQGYRVANFIKLWTLILPENLDLIVEDVIKNLLEMAMTRAFQTLPPSELERVFGKPMDGSNFSTLGLNVISPLLQGVTLSPSSRHQFSLQLKRSEDPDIREFTDYRLQKQQEGSSYRPSLFPKFTEELCIQAVQAVADTDDELRPHLEGFLSSKSDLRSNEEPNNGIDFSWLRAQLDQAGLTPSNGSTMLALPVGTVSSRLGMILGEGLWNAKSEHSIPRGLSQYGFNQENVLLWTARFRRLTSISPGAQVGTEHPRIDILRQLHYDLICQTKLQIILVCDKTAEDLLFTDNSFFKRFTLQLKSQNINAWIDTRSKKCVYVASPPPPIVALWSNSWAQVARLSVILRFTVLMTDSRGIRPDACSSQLVVLQLIRQYDWERSGHEKMTPATLDLNIRTWLEGKGFDDGDIKALEDCAESLSVALMMLTHCHDHLRQKNKQGPMIERSKTTNTGTLDKEQMAKVRELWHKVCSRNSVAEDTRKPSAYEDSTDQPMKEVHRSDEKTRTPGPSTDENLADLLIDDMYLIDEEIIDIQQELEKDRVESSVATPGTDAIATIDLRHRSREVTARSPNDVQVQMKLVQGTHEVGLHFHTQNRWRAYVTPWLPLYVIHRGDLAARFPDMPRKATIKAETKGPGEEHPNKWASDALDNDPAVRLAFWMLFTGPKDEQYGLYLFCEGDQAAKRANTFMDWMAGISRENIVKRPRRLITFNINLPMRYTDDGGNIMPQKGEKRKRESSG